MEWKEMEECRQRGREKERGTERRRDGGRERGTEQGVKMCFLDSVFSLQATFVKQRSIPARQIARAVRRWCGSPPP